MTPLLTKSAKSWQKAKLTPEGEAVVAVLINEYQMVREMAIKLVAEAGPLLAIAVMQRKRS